LAGRRTFSSTHIDHIQSFMIPTPFSDQLFKAWLSGEATADGDLAQLVERMRAHSAKLGWADMLGRLHPASKKVRGDEVVAMARSLLEHTLLFDQALERTRELSVPDFEWALLCLYASCEQTLLDQAIHVGVLRLAAETAADDELAGRIYATLGRAMASSPGWAMHAFDAGLRRLGKDGPQALRAQLFLDLARCFSQTSKADDAMTCAHAASVLAAKAGDLVTADAAILLHATLLVEAGRFHDAAATIRPLVARQRETGIPEGEHDASIVLKQCIGRTLEALLRDAAAGEVVDLVASFERALALADDTGYRYPDEAADRSLLAGVLYAQGLRDQGLAQMRKAAAGLENGEAFDHTLAWLETAGTELLKSGHLPKAVEALGDATQLAKRKPFAEPVGRVRLLHAAALQTVGRTREAEESLRETLAESRRNSLPNVEVSALYVLGENALLGRRLEEARGHFEEAAQRAESTANSELQASALNKLGATHALLREPLRAVELHERALALHRAQGFQPGVVVDLIHLAQAYLDIANLEAARRCAEVLGQLGPQHPPAEPEWIPFAIARVAAAAGDWTVARSHFRDALLAVEARRRTFDSAEAQRRWSEQKSDLYGLTIEAAIEAGAAADAIEFLELGRHRYLRALTGIDADDEPRNWRDLVSALPLGYTAVWFGGFPRGFGVVTAALGAQGEPVLTSRFDRSLTGDDLVEAFHGELRSVHAAHADGRLVDYLERMFCERRDFHLGANAFWQRHEDAWQNSLARTCEFITQRVWPPILASVAERACELLLLPSVGCSELPVAAAAPDATGVGDGLTVCIAPSLTMLAMRPASPPLDGLAGFGFTQIIDPSEDGALPCCIAEARLAAKAFAGEVTSLRGRRATRQRVLDALAGSAVFHFMGHAFVDWEDPMRSGLVCAARKDDSGVLTVREILERVGAIRSRLIVLSACQIGHVGAGDRQNDFLNLPAALVAAGARTVVAPRWEVDDLPTAMLLSAMMERWLRNKTNLPRALADARRWLREDVTTDEVARWIDAALADPTADRDVLRRLQSQYRDRFAPAERPFAHVRHWGGFEVVGSPLP
jgi:tetratricopeptide (TPR) repeat protein